MNIKFKNPSIDTEIYSEESELALNIDNNKTSIDIKGAFNNKKLILDKINHLANRNINLSSQIEIDSTGFDIQSNIDLTEIQLDLKIEQDQPITVYFTQYIRVRFEISVQYRTQNYLTALTDYDIAGKSKVQLRFNSDQQKNPSIKVNFTLDEGNFKGKDLPFDLNQISLKGQYTNGEERNNTTTIITLDDIVLEANEEAIVANAVITNLDDPHIKADFKSQLQLSELKKWGYEPPLKTLIGDASLACTYKGKIGMRNKASFDLAMAEKTADIDIKNLTVLSDEHSPKLSQANLTIRLVNDHLDISSFKGHIAKESKFSFVGAIENVFSYLILKNAPLKIGGNLDSDWMMVDELISSDNTTKTKVRNPDPIRLPNKIIANLNIKLEDLTYDRFHMRNFKTKISYKDRLLKAKNIELETMSGKITSDLTFEQIKSGKMRANKYHSS